MIEIYLELLGNDGAMMKEITESSLETCVKNSIF